MAPIVELTGTYDFMLPLLACCLVAYGVAEALRERANRLAAAQAQKSPQPCPAKEG